MYKKMILWIKNPVGTVRWLRHRVPCSGQGAVTL